MRESLDNRSWGDLYEVLTAAEAEAEKQDLEMARLKVNAEDRRADAQWASDQLDKNNAAYRRAREAWFNGGGAIWLDDRATLDEYFKGAE